MLKKLPLQAVSTLLNRALALDTVSVQRLKTLANQSLHIECTEPTFDIALFIDSEGEIQLETVDQYASYSTHIRGTLSAFLHLSQSEDKASAMMASGLYLSGNSLLLQELSEIFQAADIDIEWFLSHKIGDVPAHFIAEMGRKGQQWLSEKQPLFKRHLQEFVLEETQLVPRHEEIEAFINQVQTIKQRTERLEAKIRRLMQG